MRSLLLFLIFLFWKPAFAPASQNTPFQSPPVSQIVISGTNYSETAPGKYLLAGSVQNPTQETREVVVRGLLTFYDRTSPQGDVPLFVLRKDMTFILKAGETRPIEMPLINEGGMPRGALRVESLIRVRRQRIWNY